MRVILIQNFETKLKTKLRELKEKYIESLRSRNRDKLTEEIEETTVV
jgi:hypothetical protein